ncbi:MAG: vacuolar-type H+-ATPase subunit C/Vma6 [Candidatus Woesearchaeota archaeon]|jgi:vacuolar-type H+-ATPase subunit C/Vma6
MYEVVLAVSAGIGAVVLSMYPLVGVMQTIYSASRARTANGNIIASTQLKDLLNKDMHTTVYQLQQHGYTFIEPDMNLDTMHAHIRQQHITQIQRIISALPKAKRLFFSILTERFDLDVIIGFLHANTSPFRAIYNTKHFGTSRIDLHDDSTSPQTVTYIRHSPYAEYFSTAIEAMQKGKPIDEVKIWDNYYEKLFLSTKHPLLRQYVKLLINFENLHRVRVGKPLLKRGTLDLQKFGKSPIVSEWGTIDTKTNITLLQRKATLTFAKEISLKEPLSEVQVLSHIIKKSQELSNIRVTCTAVATKANLQEAIV